jgi:hypothetical protein
LRADFNGDTVVDAADYVVWRKNLGQTLPSPAVGGEASAAVVQTNLGTSVARSVGEHLSQGAHPGVQNQAPEPRGASRAEQTVDGDHFGFRLIPETSRRSPHRPGISARIGEPHPLAVLIRDDALMAWLSSQPQTRNDNALTGFDRANVAENNDLKNADDYRIDSLCAAFALLANG